MKYVIFFPTLMLFITFLTSCLQPYSIMGSVDTTGWGTRSLTDYEMTIRYPPDAKFDKVFAPPGGLTGGPFKGPYEIGMRSQKAPYLSTGVTYEFAIRFIMLTDAAELNPLHAKRYRWKTRPSINLFPFDYARDKDALQTAIERLYLCSPMELQHANAANIAGKSGAWFSGWDDRMKNKKSLFFHEIVGVPLATNKVLLVQAVYSHLPSENRLVFERRIFSNIVHSISFEDGN